VTLYGQEPEVRLLSTLLARLEHRSVIDVGAERGDVADELLRAGAQELYAFDPHPDNARSLRARFQADPRVHVGECAVSDSDGAAELHVSIGPDGERLPYGHTLLERPNTDEIAWRDTLTVNRRSLGSLIESGEAPAQTGILKVDTEGHDLAVILGIGSLQADIVMVEHWEDLTHGLGRCPWMLDDLLAALRPRGFSHFAFIVHRAEFVTLKWDDGAVESDAMGNLVFIHDRVLARVMPDVLECAGELAELAVRVGDGYRRAAADRLELLEELKHTAEERLALIDELTETAEERLQAVQTLGTQLGERDAELREREAELREREAELSERDAEVSPVDAQPADGT
jgi:FkbM family methyltransferase